MSEITMFAAYSHKENIVTNNTMLLLKTIYNDSLVVFDRLISRLVDLDGLEFGLKFEQQVYFKIGDAAGIVDGLIQQKPIRIFIETKATDWFHTEQIERYKKFLAAPRSKNERNILILLSNFESKNRLFNEVLGPLSDDRDEAVPIAAIGFDELLQAVKDEVRSENDVIRTMIVDFETYLTEKGLLPTWAGTLTVIPMGGSLELNKRHGCYSCPSQKRGYSHARAKFVGFYNQKKIDDVAEIDAVMEMKSRDQESWDFKWNNTEADEKILKARAEKIIADRDYYANNDFDRGDAILFFLLSNQQTDVNFQKESPGGIMGRRYMRFKDVKSMDELLKKIKGKTWEKVKDEEGL